MAAKWYALCHYSCLFSGRDALLGEPTVFRNASAFPSFFFKERADIAIVQTFHIFFLRSAFVISLLLLYLKDWWAPFVFIRNGCA